MSSRPEIDAAPASAPPPTTVPALRSFMLDSIDANLLRPFPGDAQRKVVGALRTVVATDDATVAKILEALARE